MSEKHVKKKTLGLGAVNLHKLKSSFAVSCDNADQQTSQRHVKKNSRSFGAVNIHKLKSSFAVSCDNVDQQIS